jgi:adenylosuccinate lyase
MKLSTLTAISPLDGRYFDRTSVLCEYFSEYAFLKAMAIIEIKYLIALSEFGIPRKLKKFEIIFLENFIKTLDLKKVEAIKKIDLIIDHDLKSVEKYLRQELKKAKLYDVIEYLHFGLTSMDVKNTANSTLLKSARDTILFPQLLALIDHLVKLSNNYKNVPILARTHGQPAVPTTLGKELVNFAFRLSKEVQKMKNFPISSKLNGAVGNFNAHCISFPNKNWISFSKKFIKSLGLQPNLITTQINSYDDSIEFLQILQRINNIILDLDQDMWRYISDNWFVQEIKKEEVGSSTMPQKVNPIAFENSEANLIMANSLIEGMARKLQISRLQHDLSDTAILRNIGVIFGHSLLAYKNSLKGLTRARPNLAELKLVLNENWNILSEGVQTILRREGVKDPYSLIAGLSKGKRIGLNEWKDWVNGLPIQDRIKDELMDLSPEKYIGKATQLTDLAITEIKQSRK